MLVVPLGIIGALLAATARGVSNDVYFQIAFLVTMGLSAKNAILIVEFAKEQMSLGVGLIEATVEGAAVQWRPTIVGGISPAARHHGGRA